MIIYLFIELKLMMYDSVCSIYILVVLFVYSFHIVVINSTQFVV